MRGRCSAERWWKTAPSSAPVCELGHLPPRGKAAAGRGRPALRGFAPAGGGGAFRSSLRQTDFQALRAMKIGPLPCGGHAFSAIPQGHWLHKPLVYSRCVAGAGGAVSARPLIRHGLWPCHLPPRGKARIKMRPCLPTTSVMCCGRLDCRFWQLRAGCHSQGQPHSPIL